MVCYLYASALAHGVVVEIDIRALVEAVVRGDLGWWGDVVVHIGEAIGSVRRDGVCRAMQPTHRVKSDTSPCCGGIVAVSLGRVWGESGVQDDNVYQAAKLQADGRWSSSTQAQT